MIINLFSTFDPSTSFISLNWLRTLIIIFFIPFSFWMIPSRLSIIWILTINILYKEIKILIIRKKSKGSSLILLSLFFFIIINNFIGLFPYIFTRTRHIVITIRLAIPLWLSFLIYGWINNTILIFAHLVPQGTPSILIPFIVCIETISNIIRPGTLAIRLSANIIAGHLLITLLGRIGPSLSYYILRLLIVIQIILLILEIAVSIIQSYVFTILTTLYSREVN